MKVFTLTEGKVAEGARVEEYAPEGVKFSFPAIVIGEEGRNRKRGILPVGVGKVNGAYPALRYAIEGKTQSGRPKVVEDGAEKDEDICLVIFRTPIGFRGGNDHTGDIIRKACPRVGTLVGGSYSECPDCGSKQPGNKPESIPDQIINAGDWTVYGDGVGYWKHPDSGTIDAWLPFPGRVLCEGHIAQGDAGRMGFGKQFIAIMKAGEVFRTYYTGRLYGDPPAHYCRFDGKSLVAMTRQDRELADQW